LAKSINPACAAYGEPGSGQRHDDPRLDLERRPVRQDRLAAAHLRHSEIATFVIEFPEAVETIPALAEHPARLANIAELLGQFQQADLR